jgi:lysozyme family protein
MSNFTVWWPFCQQPNHDGHANDATADGAGVTRWGWTYPTYMDARHYMGATPVYEEFVALTQPQAEALARVYIWPVKGGLLLNGGPDVVVVDWEWTSGGAAREIQFRLGFVESDVTGRMDAHTAHAINLLDRATFINNCTAWRKAYYTQLGYKKRYPGLYTRADGARLLGFSLLPKATS